MQKFQGDQGCSKMMSWDTFLTPIILFLFPITLPSIDDSYLKVCHHFFPLISWIFIILHHLWRWLQKISNFLTKHVNLIKKIRKFIKNIQLKKNLGFYLYFTSSAFFIRFNPCQFFKLLLAFFTFCSAEIISWKFKLKATKQCTAHASVTTWWNCMIIMRCMCLCSAAAFFLNP